jgi:hypothetical protein
VCGQHWQRVGQLDDSAWATLGAQLQKLLWHLSSRCAVEFFDD